MSNIAEHIKFTEKFEAYANAKDITIILCLDDEVEQLEDQEIEKICKNMKLDEGLTVFIRNQIKVGKNVVIYKKISIAQLIIDALGDNPRTLKISSEKCEIPEEDKTILKNKYPNYKFAFEPESGLVFKKKIEVPAELREKIMKEFEDVHEKVKSLIEDSKTYEKLVELLKKKVAFKICEDGLIEFVLDDKLNVYPHDEESINRVIKNRFGDRFSFTKTEEGPKYIIGSLKMKR
jgi:hypothetical protein